MDSIEEIDSIAAHYEVSIEHFILLAVATAVVKAKKNNNAYAKFFDKKKTVAKKPVAKKAPAKKAATKKKAPAKKRVAAKKK